MAPKVSHGEHLAQELSFATAYRGADYDPRVPKTSTKTVTKSLNEETNDAGREALQAFIDARFGGNRAAFVRAVNKSVTKSTVSDYLNGFKGAGGKIAAVVLQLDVTVGLAMLGAEIPELRSAPWVPEVATRLQERFPADVVGWAIIQALQFGCGRTPEALYNAALPLIAAHLAMGAACRE